MNSAGMFRSGVPNLNMSADYTCLGCVPRLDMSTLPKRV